MKAQVGDWLVIKGTTTELADQRGLITDVHGPDGSPPYVVRWLNTGHEATIFPGSDALIVTAAEQQKAIRQLPFTQRPLYEGPVQPRVRAACSSLTGNSAHRLQRWVCGSTTTSRWAPASQAFNSRSAGTSAAVSKK